MKAPQSRIGLLSCSLMISSCLTTRCWPSLVFVLPPDLFDDSYKFYYPERVGDNQTYTLSLSPVEVFVPHEHNLPPDPFDLSVLTRQFARIEEKIVTPRISFFPSIKGFVSTRPPRVLGVGGKTRKKQNIRPRRR